MFNTQAKIVSAASLRRKLAAFRRSGKRIAFTNGCFDILHCGHVSYLESAKKSNRILIVGLNSDTSIKQIKGPLRPINHQHARACVLAALACVDYVVIFNESTPYQLIKVLQPDILIKGSDWKGKEIAGADIVKERGGRVELIRYLPQYSTTKILELMKQGA